MKGTYGFQTGFYGLTDIPAVLQKAWEYTWIASKNIYCLLDDLLKISKITEHDNKKYLIDCLRGLEEENFRNNLLNFHLAKLEKECFGYHISSRAKNLPFCVLKHQKQETSINSWFNTLN